MALIQFVQNYQDLSTDRGFQFKFHCDKCGNGYMTRFQTSTFGVAEAALGIASNLFGGIFNQAHNAEYEIQRAVGGKAHDAALAEAVTEGKTYFHQCGRCAHWVCPEVCWNGDAALCDACAPKFQQEMAAAHAQAKVSAARVQLNEAASKVDYVAGVDLSADAVMRAPGAPAPAQPPPPQAAAQVGGAHCTGCGTGLVDGVKFCPQCGLPRKAPGCPGCGAAIQAGTKFCGQCGARFG
jgi:Double zinc ribbon